MRRLFFLLLVPATAFGQVADGIPDPTGTFTERTLCHAANGFPVCEVVRVPDTVQDFAPVGFIENSPRDPGRTFDKIPTFFLAKFHYWLFSQALFRAQRQYADCVAGIREIQIAMNVSPVIDGDGSPLKEIVNTIREYEVPFEALQKNYAPTIPANLEDAIVHVVAAVASVNLTVANRTVCEWSREAWRAQFRQWQAAQVAGAVAAAEVEICKRRRCRR